MTCPNKTHPEYEEMVAEYGDIQALRYFMLGVYNLAQAKDFEQRKIASQQEPSTELKRTLPNLTGSTSDKINTLFNEGVFVEKNGRKFFKQNQTRLGVIVNVNGVEIPFYQSQGQTGGKTTNWTPFYGNTGSWLIKSSIDKINNGLGIKAIQDMMVYLDKNIPEYLSSSDYFTEEQRQTLNSEITSNSLGKLQEQGNDKVFPEVALSKKEVGETLSNLNVIKYDINTAPTESSESYEFVRRIENLLSANLKQESISQQQEPSIKKGVPELFEENPELANAVYEALGFDKQRLLNIVADSLDIKINSLSEKELLEYLENNKSNIRFDFLNAHDRINNDKIYHLIKNNGSVSEINKLISQSKNLAVNNKILPEGLKFTNSGYTIIGNATNFKNITFQTGGTIKIKSVITSNIFNGINVNSNIIADNASEEFRISANKKTSEGVFKKISKYQSILNTGLAPKQNFEHTVLITSNPPLGYTLGLKGESWNIEIGADTEKFPNELYEKFRITHIANRKLSIDKPLGWVGGKIINNTLVITELQSDLLQNTFEIPSKISGVSKSAVENYFKGWEYTFLQTAINQMKEKYPNITYISLPSSSLYAAKIPLAKNISKLYDKLSKEYNFSEIKKSPLNINVIPIPIDKFQSRKGFTITDKNGKKEIFTIDFDKITSDKGYSKTIPSDKFNKIIVNKGKGGVWRIFNPEQAERIIQNFVQNDSYFDKYQDNRYIGFNVIKLSELSKPVTNNYTKEYYDVYIKTYIKSFVKEMKISNPDLASDFELAYDAIEFSKDDINLKQFYNSEYGIKYLEKLNEWIDKEFSKDAPTQDIADTTDDGGVLVDSEGNEINEIYEENEIDRLIKNVNKKEDNNDYTSRDVDYLLDELNIAIKEKNKVRQDVIKQILTEINTKGDSSIKYDNTGKIQGFTHNGNIFLNKDSENKTLIEEAAHLWLYKIKISNPTLYSEGLEKVKNSIYVQEVLNNSFYVKEALKLGNELSKEYQDYILEEALSKAIKDEGAKLVSKNKKTFLEWLIKLYNALIKLTGLENKTIEEVKKMSLQEFSKESLYDVFNIKEKGKEVNKTFLQQKQQAQQLYSQYLDTIFPDSKVKDIAYRGDSTIDYVKEKTGVFGKGIYFSQSKVLAEFHAKKINGTVNAVILNFKNPNTEYYFHPDFEEKTGYKNVYKGVKVKSSEDGIVGLRADSLGEIKEYVAFEPEQIHILGSEKDIEGFKKFASVKDEVKEVFKSNPELASIGTLEQYSAYLDTIFPDSKVKDIVYKGGSEKIDYIKDFDAVEKAVSGSYYPDFNRKGLFFSNKKELAVKYGKVSSYLLDLSKASEYTTGDESSNIDVIETGKYGDESRIIYLKNPKDESLKKFKDLAEYIVFKPEQIHRLGSEQDIEGFEKFIKDTESSSPALPTEVAEDESRFKQMPFTKDDISSKQPNSEIETNLPEKTLADLFEENKKVLVDNDITIDSLKNAMNKNNLKISEVEEWIRNCLGGNMKSSIGGSTPTAEKGMKSSKFTKGGTWKVIKDLKGFPTHEQGGVDLVIGKDGVNITNGSNQFKAEYGLVIPKNN